MTDPILTTERLILRPLRIDDAEALHSFYADAEAMRFMDTPPLRTVPATGQVIERMLQPEASCWWAMVRRDATDDEADRAIGTVGYLGNAGVPGLGYMLARPYWGRGYTTEAVAAALDYGFAELALDRVEVWIVAENAASIRVAQKTGFIRRGRFRQQYSQQAHSHDKEVYGLAAGEWRQIRADQQPVTPVQTGHDLYSAQAVLAVDDVQKTANWYRDVLGFEIDFLYGNPPTHGGVSYVQWTPEGVRIQFSQAPRTRDRATTAMSQVALPVVLYLFMGPDIDSLYERYRAAGVTIHRELATHPWGMREFQILDCNGYSLRFGTPAR